MYDKGPKSVEVIKTALLSGPLTKSQEQTADANQLSGK